MSGDRAQNRLLKDVAYAVVNSYRRMAECNTRGDEDGRDEAMSRLQNIENGVTVIEHNTNWRRTRAPGAKR